MIIAKDPVRTVEDADTQLKFANGPVYPEIRLEPPPPSYEEIASGSDYQQHPNPRAFSSSSLRSTPSQGDRLQRQSPGPSQPSQRAPSQNTAPIHSQPDPRAVNHVSINRPLGSIDSSYVLDPTLNMGASKNLSLKTTVGAITAGVLLQHREGVEVKSRTELEFITTLGPLVISVDTAPSASRPPFHIKAATHSGNVQLQLSRSFNGLLNIKSKLVLGGVILSPELEQSNRWIKSSMSSKKGFVGNVPPEFAENTWSGDEVSIETTVGTVEIGFIPAPLPAMILPQL